MKKRICAIAKLMVIVFMPVFLWAFASMRYDRHAIRELHVQYLGDENVYLTEQQIRNIITQGHQLNEIHKDETSISQMEERMSAHPMVAKAQVYLTLDGVLNVDIQQKKPIARVCEGKRFVYMDEKGEEMPLSEIYSARVPLISGKINKEDWRKIYNLVRQIRVDHFLEKNVTAIEVLPASKYQLYLRIPRFTVLLGGEEKFLEKMARLKAFYKKAERDSLLDKYERVDLRYDNQVVALRK